MSHTNLRELFEYRHLWSGTIFREDRGQEKSNEGVYRAFLSLRGSIIRKTLMILLALIIRCMVLVTSGQMAVCDTMISPTCQGDLRLDFQTMLIR